MGSVDCYLNTKTDTNLSEMYNPNWNLSPMMLALFSVAVLTDFNLKMVFRAYYSGDCLSILLFQNKNVTKEKKYKETNHITLNLNSLRYKLNDLKNTDCSKVLLLF